LKASAGPATSSCNHWSETRMPRLDHYGAILRIRSGEQAGGGNVDR
jgi:hypothetical protein